MHKLVVEKLTNILNPKLDDVLREIELLDGINRSILLVIGESYGYPVLTIGMSKTGEYICDVDFANGVQITFVNKKASDPNKKICLQLGEHTSGRIDTEILCHDDVVSIAKWFFCTNANLGDIPNSQLFEIQ